MQVLFKLVYRTDFIVPLFCRMAHTGDTPQTPIPHPIDVEPETMTIEVDPQLIVPTREPRRARQDEAGSWHEPLEILF